MGNDVLLSICMPTYNRLQHIQRQIKYFINELELSGNGLVEVIISNNASTDGTKGFLKEYEGKFDWLRINNNQENVGAYGNMTWLLNHARGKYIWIPGDDDYLKKGVVNNILLILSTNNITYLYLSRRPINEQTKQIQQEWKRFAIDYDRSIRVEYDKLVSLTKENYSDLKFQTSSIFLTENALKYYNESKIYPVDIQANCHSLFKSIRSMQDGLSYFYSDVCILSGIDISWGDSMINYLFNGDPQFVMGLTQFGFKKNDCIQIAKRQKAAAALSCITQPHLFCKWKNAGFIGFGFSLVPTMFYLILRKFARLFGLSKSHSVIVVDSASFII